MVQRGVFIYICVELLSINSSVADPDPHHSEGLIRIR